LTGFAQKDYNRTVFYMSKVLTLYADDLGQHHPYISTARSALNQVLKENRDAPSAGHASEGGEDSRTQGVKGSKP